MSDLLVRLYDLPDVRTEEKIASHGITVRRAMAAEAHIVLPWIERHFYNPWVSEATRAFTRSPVMVWIAVRHNELLGFACADCSMRGFFGPTGVAKAARGQGIGEALLFTTLRGMREAEYAYAVIGGVGPLAFYRKHLDAIDIPGSEESIYGPMLHDDKGRDFDDF
ncbi:MULTISPECIES: GNAT family N-acetyltransferase [Bradyrhizobium]|jgi:GNAT superfamily N-acetyltransferase|nr:MULTISPECIES: GNAT family N-acetyltransferase [Bradyrhizobium]MBP1066491.1 GNAT superfamily N-acetyltransferase [Bradyrhizobium japonicum]AND88930.1 GNAT family acetyltransferase [Bradyrhizobium diazoefficiens USDA 110]AWO90518.2 GNAT family N-acetyltransferase [Bradyrhizobium diazoefficiens]QLD44681.1 GNAT family N-acetyltransferase [Bradyrhizobium diazoefficiens]WLA59782.1 GNAT family N-acetyltransferase [Bradyrhizobium diazoefficiens]